MRWFLGCVPWMSLERTRSFGLLESRSLDERSVLEGCIPFLKDAFLEKMVFGKTPLEEMIPEDLGNALRRPGVRKVSPGRNPSLRFPPLNPLP